MGSKVIRRLIAGGELLPPSYEQPNSMDLFRAVACACGAEGLAGSPAQTALAARLAPAAHLVTVLVDGLGLMLEGRFPSGGLLATTPRQELRAIFPPTTASVLTSMATCRWPAEHGIPGWFAFLPDRGLSIVPLRFRERGTETRLDLSPSEVFAADPVQGGFSRTSRTYLPKTFVRDIFSVWARQGSPGRGYSAPGSAARKLVRHVRRCRRPSYTHLYLTGVDHRSHRTGWASDAVDREVEEVDAALALIRDGLPSSALLVVTADHGQVIVPQERRFALRQGDPLLDLLLAPPSGEPTTPVFHAREGLEREFRSRFQERFADAFVLLSLDEVEELRLYGPMPLSPEMRRRLGTFVGISPRPTSLEYVEQGAEPLSFTGVHGGLRPDEMRVPLYLL